MSATIPRFSNEILGAFRCPICRSPLNSAAESLRCRNLECGAAFPSVDGVPILLNESRSLFSIDSYSRGTASKGTAPTSSLRAGIRRFIPSISRNVLGASNFQKYADLLLNRAKVPRVLVIGGKNEGEGFNVLLSNVPPIELVETDVVFGPRTMLICDSHDIPFEDNFFDGVIVQAVLEHVVDPYRCVEEIFRVLQPAGLVYAETPFIQQVHEGRYDFTRFTDLGHRRLFRRFEEVASGPVCGPGMALAWSYRHFLVSLSESRWVSNLLDTFARCTSFFLTSFDRLSIGNVGTFDAASAYYFLGRKSDSVLSDRELIKLYRGRM
jgi:SAM-dependent methyltransferase